MAVVSVGRANACVCVVVLAPAAHFLARLDVGGAFVRVCVCFSCPRLSTPARASVCERVWSSHGLFVASTTSAGPAS